MHANLWWVFCLSFYFFIFSSVAMSLIASVFNMRGTTHSNELIWYFDTGLDSTTGKFFVITCNRIRLGGLDGILVFTWGSVLSVLVIQTATDNRILSHQIFITTNWSMLPQTSNRIDVARHSHATQSTNSTWMKN